jgi:hypothetical protein
MRQILILKFIIFLPNFRRINHKLDFSSSFFLKNQIIETKSDTDIGGDVKKNTFRHFNTIHFSVSNFFMFFCNIIKIKFIYLAVTNYVTFKNRKKKL